VAAVRWGTRPEQQTVRATLATIGDQPLATPSVIVVGDVAAEDLSWFERRPLFGKRIVVTRTREQASQLAVLLRDAGAEPVEVPVIAVSEPTDAGAALSAAARQLHLYDWVVLTSPNGARRLLDEVATAGGDARWFAGAKLAAIGPGTAAALLHRGLRADLVPERFVAEALLDAFPSGPGRVLLARAEVARDVLPDGLEAKGWDVHVVDAYRTVPVPQSDSARAALEGADVITFTSSSTVDRFIEAFGLDAVPPVVACIGPITAATARAHGLTIDVEADTHTIRGLVTALERWALRARDGDRA
jgi:uroporphyrinogen III methyltransferase/synthase